MHEKATILVVDDLDLLREGIRLELEYAGYEVVTACNGIEALQQLQTNAINLILADVAMPRMNGYQLFERTRENPEWIYIPFIFLTGRILDSDIRFGKELGADDYLTKPIETDDLLSAVRGKLRRAQQLISSASIMARSVVATLPPPLVIGMLRVEPASHRVWYNDQPIELSAREFALLEYLALRTEEVISAQALVLITHELELDSEEAGSIIRPLIRSIRRKLGADTGNISCIENVRGVGYRLTAVPA